jgi:hypothetical protein
VIGGNSQSIVVLSGRDNEDDLEDLLDWSDISDEGAFLLLMFSSFLDVLSFCFVLVLGDCKAEMIVSNMCSVFLDWASCCWSNELIAVIAS